MEYNLFQKLAHLYLLLHGCSMQLSATQWLYSQLLHRLWFVIMFRLPIVATIREL